MSITCHSTKRGPMGAYGQDGQSPEMNTTGLNGKEGEVKLYQHSHQQLASNYSLTFTQMLLHEAELDYLNQNFKVAASKLLWLKETVLSTETFLSEAADNLLSGQKTEDAPNETYQIKQRINVLLMQITQGLDYYGHYPGYVPLTSLDTYINAIDSMLPLAGAIEDAYDTYYESQQSNLIQRKAIATVISSLEVKLDRSSNQIGIYINKIQKSRQQVSNLLEEEEVLKAKMQEAEQAFKSAVRRKAACGFEDVLKAGAAVAAIATGVGAIAAGGTALYESGKMIENSNTLKEWKKTGEYIVKHTKTVGKGIEDISKGYQDIKGLIEQERDAAKLISAEEDFDKMIEGFSSLPEAKEYQRLMKQYLSIIKLRNNKILEIDSANSTPKCTTR